MAVPEVTVNIIEEYPIKKTTRKKTDPKQKPNRNFAAILSSISSKKPKIPKNKKEDVEKKAAKPGFAIRKHLLVEAEKPEPETEEKPTNKKKLPRTSDKNKGGNTKAKPKKQESIKKFFENLTGGRKPKFESLEPLEIEKTGQTNCLVEIPPLPKTTCSSSSRNVRKKPEILTSKLTMKEISLDEKPSIFGTATKIASNLDPIMPPAPCQLVDPRTDDFPQNLVSALSESGVPASFDHVIDHVTLTWFDAMVLDGRCDCDGDITKLTDWYSILKTIKYSMKSLEDNSENQRIFEDKTGIKRSRKDLEDNLENRDATKNEFGLFKRPKIEIGIERAIADENEYFSRKHETRLDGLGEKMRKSSEDKKPPDRVEL